jgi:hypothetical protein
MKSIAVRYREGAFVPLNPAQVSKKFKDGELYFFKADTRRYWPRHQWFMATIRSCWESLPEDLQERFPNPEFLRKHLLIKAGYSKVTKIKYSSKQEAFATASLVSKLMDDYSEIKVDGTTLRMETARSQAIKITDDDELMSNEEFTESCEMVFNSLAIMLGAAKEDIVKIHGERKVSRKKKEVAARSEEG